MSTFAAARFDELINKSRAWEAARLYAESCLETDVLAAIKPAILANLLCGEKVQGKHLSEILQQARSIEGWSLLDEGDVLRDVALAQLRAGHREKARESIAQAISYHFDDHNRLACLLAVAGRINGDPALCAKADRFWREIGAKADPQWVRNNALHWLMLVTARGGATNWHRLRIFLRFARGEKSKKKLAAGIIVLVLGRRSLHTMRSHMG